MIRKEKKKHIDEFIGKYGDIEGLKENLKAVKQNIKYFEENGEKQYREYYKFSNYTLEELKYYKRKVKKRIKDLKQGNKDRICFEILLEGVR